MCRYTVSSQDASLHPSISRFGTTCQVKSITVTTLMLLLFVFSCLTFALTPTAEDEITFIECGDIDPVDPFYFIGERLNLTCALWNIDNNETGSLYFDMAVISNGKWSNVKVNQTGYEIIQLNSTAIQLTSPVLTIDDALRHNVSRSYRCMVREDVNNCTERSRKFVSNVHVKIDYYPHNPENFSCHVYNWEKLACTWEMIPYFHEEDIAVEYFWKSDLQLGDSKTWSFEFSEKTVTSFTINDFNMMPKYSFYFQIVNKIRSSMNTSAIFNISPYEIVKPAPVDYISFPDFNDTCVVILWNHSKRFRPKVFRVRHSSKCSPEQEVTTRNSNITVCNLNPYTTYLFVVDSRPMDRNSKVDTVGFTSDPRGSSVTTKPAVPAANPKLLSYTDLQCPESPCRLVLVYWEPLSSCDLHDSPSSQQYEIITKQRGSEKMWNSTVYNSEATSHSLTLPDKEKVYEIKLRVITGHGKKREDFSHLVIWPKSQSPIAPSMVVEYKANPKTGTKFYITLHLTVDQADTAQNIYWCRSLQGRGCLEPMSFKEINGSFAEIFIQNYVMDFNIKFGVESQENSSGEITTSGIQMVSCIYHKDQRPLIPPKNFHIAKGMAEREGELSLEWDPYDCNSPELESGYVLSYNLYYCQVTDESCNMMHDLNKIQIKQDVHNYTIRELKPGGRYNVWLTARTSAGEGPATDVIDTYIYIQEFPLWGKVIIGVISLMASLVILICYVKFHHYLKERRKAFSRIEIPILTGHIQENGHVIGDNQLNEPIPFMAESEELIREIPLILNGNIQDGMTNNFYSTSHFLDFLKNDQTERLLETSLFGTNHKIDGFYISSNDINSAISDTESNRNVNDEKETKPVEFHHQNANQLPENYCRIVDNGHYVRNSKSNPVLIADRHNEKVSHLGQAVNSLLNDGSDLLGLLLDECNENSCEREKYIYSVSPKDLSNLPQEYVTIEKQLETIQMKSKDDFESSNELSLSDDGFESNELSL